MFVAFWHLSDLWTMTQYLDFGTDWQFSMQKISLFLDTDVVHRKGRVLYNLSLVPPQDLLELNWAQCWTILDTPVPGFAIIPGKVTLLCW